jgi:hypothetical protein
MPRVWSYCSRENSPLGLIELCREWLTPDMVLYEIGAFAGISTEIFSLFCQSVVAVDCWQSHEIPGNLLYDAEERFRLMMAERTNVFLSRKPSVEAAKDVLDQTISAVYIDGDHRREAIRADLTVWQAKLRPGGLLMGHDYQIREVAEELACAGLTPKKTYPDDSWVCLC